MSAPCWRERPHYSARDHEQVKAAAVALVREREAHPPTRKENTP